MRKTQVGQYEIIDSVGRDSFGETYQAVDRLHNKKVLLRHLPTESDNEELLSRLHSDATLGLLNHPNIARVLGFVRTSEDIYLVSEFVKGHTLRTILQERGKMTALTAASLVRQIMPGVAFAHGFGVVHGNLNPSNILLPDYGPIKILNFGLIYLFGGYHRSDHFEARYLSPEQIGGSPSDTLSDIYSLGMIFYEAIAGKTPADFYSSSNSQASKPPNELIPIPLSLLLADIPEWLDDFLLRMIAPNPAARYQSVKHAMRVLDDHCSRLEDVVESRKAESGVRARNTIVRSSGNIARPGDRLEKSSTNLASKAESRVEKGKVDYSSRKESADSPRTRGPTQARVSRTRYAHVSVLLLLIASALVVDTELRSQSSLTEDVDSMFERINAESKEPNPTPGQKELIGRKEAVSSKAKVTPVGPEAATNGSISRESQLKLERPHDQRVEVVLRKPQIQKPRSDAKRDPMVSRSEPPLVIHSNLQTEPTASREQNVKDQQTIEPTKLTEYRPMKSELKVSWDN